MSVGVCCYACNWHSCTCPHSCISRQDATTSISSRGSFFTIDTVRYCVLLESVLSGHEEWVHSVQWHPPVVTADGKRVQPMRLLSASMDKTMIIWAPRAETCTSYGRTRGCCRCIGAFQLTTPRWLGVQCRQAGNDLWMDEVRVGELGGNSLGFYGGLFGPNGDYVMSHAYNGGFHIWKRSDDERWEPQVAVSGHFGAVSDLAWHPTLPYLLSVR
jgi:elongator complex protein 2